MKCAIHRAEPNWYRRQESSWRAEEQGSSLVFLLLAAPVLARAAPSHPQRRVGRGRMPESENRHQNENAALLFEEKEGASYGIVVAKDGSYSSWHRGSGRRDLLPVYAATASQDQGQAA